MTTVSLCLIVRDEAHTLPTCLGSVRDLVDECIVMDTGSTDATAAVAREYGAAVYHTPWADSFAAARSAAFQQATGDWIWWLDADDVLLPDDRERFRGLRHTLEGTDANRVSMRYHYAFDDAGQPILDFRVVRMVRRQAGWRWVGRVHEYLEAPDPEWASDVIVTHRRTHPAGERNLRIYDLMRQQGEPFTRRDQLYYANELAQHGRPAEAVPLYRLVAGDPTVWVDDRFWACLSLAEIDAARGNRLESRRALYDTFELGPPRAEVCCHLGYDAVEREAWAEARAWYAAALALERPHTPGFIREACWTWLPHLQLAVCYDHLGDVRRACWHNEQAARWHPEDPAVLHNRAYFRARGVVLAPPAPGTSG